jgi:hypothetical protein
MKVKENRSTIPGFEAENSFVGRDEKQYLVRTTFDSGRTITITPHCL